MAEIACHAIDAREAGREATMRHTFYKLFVWPAALLQVGLLGSYLAFLLAAVLAILLHLFAGDRLYSGIPVQALGHVLHGFISVLLFLLLPALLKPLLAFRRPEFVATALRHRREKDLYAFVSHIAEAAGAPAPRWVVADLQPRVAVQFVANDGFISGKLLLRLGLPVLAELNTRQFAGLLAHELTYFSPALQPRAAFLLREINGWFRRASHHPDALDQLLARWAEEWPRLLQPVVREVRKLVEVGRKATLGWLSLSDVVARPFVRHMVAQADHAQRRVAGASVFVETVERARLLDHVARLIEPDLRNLWQERRKLVEDFAGAIAGKAQAFTSRIQPTLDEEQQAQWLRTGEIRPTDRERCDGELGSEEGLILCSRPARGISRRFVKTVRRLSYLHYRRIMKLPVTADRLITVPEYIHGLPTRSQTDTVLDHYFHGYFEPLLPLGAEAVAIRPTAPAQVRQALAEVRRAVEEGLPRVRVAHEDYADADGKQIDGALNVALLRSGARLALANGGLGRDALDAAHSYCREAEEAQDASGAVLVEHHRRAMRWLGATLTALANADGGRIPNARNLGAEAIRLLEALRRLEVVLPQVRQLRQHAIVLEALLSVKAGIGNTKLRDRIAEQAADISALLTGIRVALKDVAYPLGRNGQLLMSYLLADALNEEGPEGKLDWAMDVAQRVAKVQRKIVGRLALIARYVEQQAA